MSRTIKFAKAGGPEVLEFVEVQVPAPGPNEVRIKVKAIGINRAEAMWRVDDYFEPVKKFPAGLGYEAAGIVDAVGKDVSGFAVGDDVNVIPSFSMNDYATYGEVDLSLYSRFQSLPCSPGGSTALGKMPLKNSLARSISAISANRLPLPRGYP